MDWRHNSYSIVNNVKYNYEKDISPILSPCPGIFCGRSRMPDGNWSSCGGCPRGFRKDSSTFACIECSDNLSRYDWLYLGFMTILPILLHLMAIPRKLSRNSKQTLCLSVCAIVESVISVFLTLFLWAPDGNFAKLKSCGVSELADWYPILYNPQPNYEEVVQCTHEVVYPLFTIMLAFYAISDVVMIVVRFLASFAGIKVSQSIYAGLYFYPLLALAHLILGGVIYFIFPYITITFSVVSCSYHFASRSNQGMKSLVLESVYDWRKLGVILCHWFLHAYGIISVTELKHFWKDLSFLFLVPCPAVLYILSVEFTNPDSVLHKY